jgi:pimeloyl-ACP methyl ester carboxylesterase
MGASKPESRFVHANGVDVHYQELGEGPPVLFLHGGGPGATGWGNFQRNLDFFAQRYRAITLDLPGFGDSGSKPKDVPLATFFPATILGFLDALGIEKATIVGNSLGGMIALSLALDHPDRVDKLVLMGTGGGYPLFTPFPTPGLKTLFSFYDPPGPSIETLKRFVSEFVYDPGSLPSEFFEERLSAAMKPEILANPPISGKGGPPSTGELWRDPRLLSLPHDTLIIWGREDRVMPLDASLILLKQIPLATLHVIPKCGHWAMWEHAETFNALVNLFIDA